MFKGIKKSKVENGLLEKIIHLDLSISLFFQVNNNAVSLKNFCKSLRNRILICIYASESSFYSKFLKK